MNVSNLILFRYCRIRWKCVRILEITKRKIYSKIEKDDGLEGDNDVKNTLPIHLGAFIVGNSKQFMNKFIREFNGFYNISIYYGGTDSVYIEKKYWDVLDKAYLVGKNVCQGKNDFKTGGILNGLFLAPKIKYVLTTYEYGVIQQHMTFKGFNDSKRLLGRSQNLNMLEGKKISAMLPRLWKKFLLMALLYQQKWDIVMNVKMEYYVEHVIIKSIENKEFKANLNLLKRHPANELGHMLP